MTEACKDCSKAAAKRWHGFRASCTGCAARSVARGHNFRESQTAGHLTRGYKEELVLLKVTHEQVKAAVLADKVHAEA